MGFIKDWWDEQRGAGTAVNLSEILVDVDKTKEILDQMKAKAADIREQKKQLQNLSAQTQQCWKGVSGDSLREYLAEAIQRQEKIAGNLEQAIETLRREVNHVVEQDEALARVIRGGGSGGGHHSGGGRHG